LPVLNIFRPVGRFIYDRHPAALNTPNKKAADWGQIFACRNTTYASRLYDGVVNGGEQLAHE
jgi:hypothetical protein